MSSESVLEESAGLRIKVGEGILQRDGERVSEVEVNELMTHGTVQVDIVEAIT